MRSQGAVFFILAALWSCFFLAFSGCAHKKEAQSITENSLRGKKVVLFDISGVEKESKTLLEVAIINELLEYGHFEIVDRLSTEEAKALYPAESDFGKLCTHLGADYVLVLRVSQFKITERQGYDKTEEEDSVLAEESGEPSKKTIGTRYLKVKSNQGKILLSGLLWSKSQNAFVYQGYGSAEKTYNSRDSQKTKMSLMEELASEAVHHYFEGIPK